MALSPAELLKLAETEFNDQIPESQLGPVFTNPPFIFVDGTFNTRDLGLIANSPIRAGFVYRSGLIGQLTDNGKAVLTSKMGVKRVFDIRSAGERQSVPDPSIDGVENTWVDGIGPDSRPDLAQFAPGGGEIGYREMYLEVIDLYRPSWKVALEHIRDRPEEPFLYHCTAGRDRTGVLSGILLTLAGASEDTVAMDYMLSRIGTEPMRPFLVKFALEGCGAASMDVPGFNNLANLRASSWNAFVQGVREKYGGFEQFVSKELGFSAGDIDKIRTNLTRPRVE